MQTVYETVYEREAHTDHGDPVSDRLPGRELHCPATRLHRPTVEPQLPSSDPSTRRRTSNAATPSSDPSTRPRTANAATPSDGPSTRPRTVSAATPSSDPSTRRRTSNGGIPSSGRLRPRAAKPPLHGPVRSSLDGHPRAAATVMRPVYQTATRERRYDRLPAGDDDDDGRAAVHGLPPGHDDLAVVEEWPRRAAVQPTVPGPIVRAAGPRPGRGPQHECGNQKKKGPALLLYGGRRSGRPSPSSARPARSASASSSRAPSSGRSPRRGTSARRWSGRSPSPRRRWSPRRGSSRSP